MDVDALLDPEIAATLAAVPTLTSSMAELTLEAIPAMRARQQATALPAPPLSD
jgi:hypothetical protein